MYSHKKKFSLVNQKKRAVCVSVCVCVDNVQMEDENIHCS